MSTYVLSVGKNTHSSDVVLSGPHTFGGITLTELVYISGLSSNAQNEFNKCLKDNTSITLSGYITLSNSGNNQFTFAGATPMELGYVCGVTSAIQTQLNMCIKNNSSTTLMGKVLSVQLR